MNHPDPIIETRNKYRQTLDTLKATRDALYGRPACHAMRTAARAAIAKAQGAA